MVAETSAILSLVRRILRLLTARLRRLTDSARDEAAQDLKRLATGLVALFVMGVLLVHALAFAHGVVVVALVGVGLPLLQVLAGILGVDVLLALVAAVLGRSLLTRPILTQTREELGELRKVADGLVG